MKKILTILAAGFVLTHPAAAQRPFTVESEQEFVSAIQLQNDGLTDDVVVLDRATGLLRLGRWSGGAMTWETTPSGVADPEFLTVGNLVLPSGQAMSVAVGAPSWQRAEVLTPQTGERFSRDGLGLLPTALVALPLSGVGARESFVSGSGDLSFNGTRLTAFQNAVGAGFLNPIDDKPAGLLRSGNRVRTPLGTGAAFLANGNALQVWAWRGLPELSLDAELAGLLPGTHYAAGLFGGSGNHSYLLFVPGDADFRHVAQQTGGGGAPFGTVAAWPAGLTLGSLQAVSSPTGTANDWILAISQDGATARLFDFAPAGGPVLRQSFAAPAGQSFTAAAPQPGGNFLLLHGTGGRSTGWQRAVLSGGTHTVSAAEMLPALKSSQARATLFAFDTEPWVTPSASLTRLLRYGDWTTAAAAGGNAGFLTDLGIPSGLGSPSTISLSGNGLGGSFLLPNQVRADVSVAALGGSMNAARPLVVFNPPAGHYGAGVLPGGGPRPLNIALTLQGGGGQGIWWRINQGGWQFYEPGANPPVVPSFTEGATLEAFAGSTPGPSATASTAVTRGVYTIGSLPPLLPESFADLDGNGLSDSWEQIFRQFDPAADTDGDGADALTEMLGGTDPGNPASTPPPSTGPGRPVLFLTAVEPPPSSLLHFRLTGKPGIRHSVQSTAELATGPWTDYVPEFTMPGTGIYDFTAPYQSGQRRFFRGVAR